MDSGWVRRLVEIRASRPESVAQAAARRTGRPLVADGDRVLIIAADHTARGALGTGGAPMAMASRVDLVERVVEALSRPGVTGVLGTADVLEDLLMLGALEGRTVLGSMNRGGLVGAQYELDDRFTGYDARSLAAMRFEGGKMLLRIDATDAGSLRTMEGCARAIGDLAGQRLVAMVEPFAAHRVDGQVRNDLRPESMMRAIAVASGLGGTSAYTWLKVPVVAEMERVMQAATLPALLLGGDTRSDRDEMFDLWRAALALPTVRGLVVGRNLLYPPDGDVRSAVDTAVELLGSGVC